MFAVLSSPATVCFIQLRSRCHYRGLVLAGDLSVLLENKQRLTSFMFVRAEFCTTIGLMLGAIVDNYTQKRTDSGAYRIPIGVQVSPIANALRPSLPLPPLNLTRLRPFIVCVGHHPRCRLVPAARLASILRQARQDRQSSRPSRSPSRPAAHVPLHRTRARRDRRQR